MSLRKSVCLGWSTCLLLGASAMAVDHDLRLLDAMKAQDAKTVQALVQQRADVNAASNDGTTALHWAAYWEDAASSRVLLQAGANPNAVNGLGVPPLHLACQNKTGVVIDVLIRAKAKPDLGLPTGETPLMTCTRSGNIEGVKLLLALGANVNAKETTRNQTALMWAAANGHVDIIPLLTAAGADVHARSMVTPRLVWTGARAIGWARGDLFPLVTYPLGGFTPLLFAAQQGDIEAGKALLSAGANVNEKAPTGASALVVAAHSGQGRFASFLIEKGADVNSAEAGYASLHAAVLRGDVALVKDLLAHGADPNVVMTKGTPVRKYSEDFVLNAEWRGATPFWLAAKFAEVDIMRALVAKGADPNKYSPHLPVGDKDDPAPQNAMPPIVAAINIKGHRREMFLTPRALDAVDPVAERKLTLKAVETAIELGADVNLTDNVGTTALHVAASQRFDEAIELLARSGANLNAKDKMAKTPLDLALTERSGTRREASQAPSNQPAARPANKTAELLRTLGATE